VSGKGKKSNQSFNSASPTPSSVTAEGNVRADFDDTQTSCTPDSLPVSAISFLERDGKSFRTSTSSRMPKGNEIMKMKGKPKAQNEKKKFPVRAILACPLNV
jgi:hypothetical protein